MPVYKNVRLPAHVTSQSPSIAAPFDSCFYPAGFLFPESREELDPYREFPLSEPFYATPRKSSSNVEDILALDPTEDSDANFDSTILQISELDELLLEVQGMGMQYTMHTQMMLRSDFAYNFPNTWDKSQSLLLNIPVFTEELCQWHYPISTMGYNIANTEPPPDIDIANNYPQLFGYLPNGDIAVYWEIGEILGEEFGIDLDPMQSTVDGTLILMPGMAEQIKASVPGTRAVGTGVVVEGQDNPGPAISNAAQWLGRPPTVIRYALYPFYRFRLPVIHCELDFNPYGEATWGAFGYTSPRLSGFEFKIVNNPFTRQVPIFATERGNIIVSTRFYDRLKQLVTMYGGSFGAQTFPIQRIP